MIEFQTNLANYILGMPYNEKVLIDGLEKFPMCKYEGMIYRGITSKKYFSPKEIRSQKLCSWSSSKEVAKEFARTYRYGYVLKRKSTGVSIQKLLDYLHANNMICVEKLKRCGTKYEKEVLDNLDDNFVLEEKYD